MHSSSIQESNEVYSRLHCLILILMDFKKDRASDSRGFLTFINKFKSMTKQFIKEEPEKAFQAKLLIRRDYKKIDC
jgi:hypothetical protein